jgi:hypothetical protein
MASLKNAHKRGFSVRLWKKTVTNPKNLLLCFCEWRIAVDSPKWLELTYTEDLSSYRSFFCVFYSQKYECGPPGLRPAGIQSIRKTAVLAK